MVTAGRETPTSRHLLIDALRGLCFVLMTMDHLPSNVFSRFSNPVYGPFGFFTAASGFVFLAGLVAGMVYERTWQRTGPQGVLRRVWRRCRTLYLTHLALYGFLWALVVLHVPGSTAWHLDLVSTHPWQALGLGVVLLYEPGFFGILPMYCFFLALTPLVLWAMRRGHLWGVLSGSIALWAVAGLLIHLPVAPEGICFGALNPLSYQLLFSVGLACGAGHLSMQGLRPHTARQLVRLAGGLTVGFLVLRVAYATSTTVVAWVQACRGLSVIQLGPVRVLNSLAFGVTLYGWARHREWERCSHLFVRSCAFLGQHALPVFIWSLLTTYLAMAVLPEHLLRSLSAVALLVVVGSLWCPAFLHARLRPHRAQPWSASPAGKAPVAPARTLDVDVGAATVQPARGSRAA